MGKLWKSYGNAMEILCKAVKGCENLWESYERPCKGYGKAVKTYGKAMKPYGKPMENY